MSSVVFVKMQDGTVNIVGKQGATWEAILQIKDANDNAVDISGYVFRGQIRETYSTATKTAEFVFTIQNASQGKVIMSMPATATAGIQAYKEYVHPEKTHTYKGAGVYVYDVEMEDQIKDAASSNQLAAGEMYLITDEGRVAVGTSPSTYVVLVKSDDIPFWFNLQ